MAFRSRVVVLCRTEEAEMEALKRELETHMRAIDALTLKMLALSRTEEHRDDPIKRLETSQVFLKKANHELYMAQVVL